MTQINDPLSTSTSLLDHVRNGEQVAWFRLVRIYTPLIQHWCYRAGIRGADSEDIAQNVFLSVSKQIAEFGKDRFGNSFRGWLRTITRSKIMDLLRARKKNPAGEGRGSFADGVALEYVKSDREWVGDQTSSEATRDLHVLILSVLEMIQQDFSQQTWMAFWKTVALGQRPSEVAQELGMSAAAVCMCRARVLRRLRETIGDF